MKDKRCPRNAERRLIGAKYTTVKGFYWALSLTNKSSAQYSTSLQIDSEDEERLIPVFDRVCEAAAASSACAMTNYNPSPNRTTIIENAGRKGFFTIHFNWNGMVSNTCISKVPNLNKLFSDFMLLNIAPIENMVVAISVKLTDSP